jgi:hypothetical protein
MTQDTTVKKVSSGHSPTGPQGQVYLASGKRVCMRLWREHTYRILETFTAVEATAPPAQVHGREGR